MSAAAGGLDQGVNRIPRAVDHRTLSAMNSTTNIASAMPMMMGLARICREGGKPHHAEALEESGGRDRGVEIQTRGEGGAEGEAEGLERESVHPLDVDAAEGGGEGQVEVPRRGAYPGRKYAFPCRVQPSAGKLDRKRSRREPDPQVAGQAEGERADGHLHAEPRVRRPRAGEVEQHLADPALEFHERQRLLPSVSTDTSAARALEYSFSAACGIRRRSAARQRLAPVLRRRSVS